MVIQERRPALTIEVAEGYFTSNLSGQEGFALADGFYSKTIAEDDLEFTFSDDPDGTSTKIFNEILKQNFGTKIYFFFRNHFELHIGHWFISNRFRFRRFYHHQVRINFK